MIRYSIAPKIFPVSFGCMFLFLSLSVKDLAAQPFQVHGMAGYQWGGSLNEASFVSDAEVQAFDLNLQGAPNFGLSFDMRLNDKLWLSLPLDIQRTEFNLREEDQEERTLFDVNMYFAHLGLIFEGQAAGLTSYLRISGGVTLIDAKHGFSNSTRGSASVTIGAKKFITEAVGINVHGRFLSTYLPGSGEIFCDSQDNCVMLSDVTFLSQFNVNAGIFVAFEL